MPSVSYSDFQSVMNLDPDIDVSAANTENLLDYAIDLLNVYGNLSISNMSGAAGSKTVTLTSKQRGAVFMVARALYYSDYRSQIISSVGGVSITPMSITENPMWERFLSRAARQLAGTVIKRTS